jgi:hypothetical protein
MAAAMSPALAAVYACTHRKKAACKQTAFLKGASLSQPRPFKGLSSKTQSFKDLLQKRQHALLRLVTVKRGTSSANNRL